MSTFHVEKQNVTFTEDFFSSKMRKPPGFLILYVLRETS